MYLPDYSIHLGMINACTPCFILVFEATWKVWCIDKVVNWIVAVFGKLHNQNEHSTWKIVFWCKSNLGSNLVVE